MAAPTPAPQPSRADRTRSGDADGRASAGTRTGDLAAPSPLRGLQMDEQLAAVEATASSDACEPRSGQSPYLPELDPLRAQAVLEYDLQPKPGFDANKGTCTDEHEPRGFIGARHWSYSPD